MKESLIRMSSNKRARESGDSPIMSKKTRNEPNISGQKRGLAVSVLRRDDVSVKRQKVVGIAIKTVSNAEETFSG